MRITLATWNAEWITARSRAFPQATQRVEDLAADLLVLTEVTTELIPERGYRVCGGEDWGYTSPGGRHKVALWSRLPITDPLVDRVAPPGRHVAGTVHLPAGPVRVHAVCVPWRDAHVRTGRKDSEPWQEHAAFLESLSFVLAKERESVEQGAHRILMGDVNQRGGRYPYRSAEVERAWGELLKREGMIPCTPDEVVDKIVLSEGLKAEETRVLPPDGISDHHAVATTIVLP